MAYNPQKLGGQDEVISVDKTAGQDAIRFPQTFTDPLDLRENLLAA